MKEELPKDIRQSPLKKRVVWSRRNFKRFLFVCACVVTLNALFYAEENWRGKSAWENYKREWEAKGENFDWLSLAPAPVPDDQNFAMSPVWIASIKFNFLDSPEKAQAWYGDKIDSEDVSKFLSFIPITTGAVVGTNWANNLSSMPAISVNWALAQMVDLKPWQSYYRDMAESNHADISITPQPQSPAADVLLALRKFDPAIEQLQKDSQLPYSRFPVQWDDPDPAEILLPHLAKLKQAATVLELRAIAELQNGQPDKAFDDVKLILRLTDAVRTEPIIITHLVRMAIMQMAVQIIYEGLSRHQWSDAQLAEMDSELARIDYLADYQLSVRGERAGHVKIMTWLLGDSNRYQILLNVIQGFSGVDVDNFRARAAFHLMPSGWLYQGNILQAQAHQYWLASPVDDTNQIIHPANTLEVSNKVNVLFNHGFVYSLLPRIITPDLTAYVRRTAYNQTSANLARIAIALERYRLANGKFPDSLDALAPQFMQQVPHDVIKGGPMLYRLDPDGQFVLYSVGWNTVDDGGVVVPPKSGAESRYGLNYGSNPVDLDQGDWVWRYPEK